jgi:MYXO-CTERM domain-containing protein
VSLSATPAEGSEFAGWMGACMGTSACAVTLGVDTSVTAVFNKKPVVNNPNPTNPNPTNPNPTNPGDGKPGADTTVSACSTTGSSSGTWVPALMVLGLALIARRKRS